MLSRKEVNDWKLHPVTQEIFKQFQHEIDQYSAAFIRGQYIGKDIEGTALSVARMSGIVEGLLRIFDVEGVDVDE